MRVPFNKIFAEIDDHLVPLRAIGIGNVTIAPGLPLHKSLRLSGIEIRELIGHDLVVEMEDGITMIEGYHQEEPPFAV